MLRDKGFSLLELMIVIAIFGILAAVMTPSFLAWRDRSKVKGDATELRSVFESAKLRAIKHNTNAVVAFPDATSYQAFVDTNEDGIRDAGEDTIVIRTLAPGVTITTNTFGGNDMVFNSRGMAEAGRVIMTSPGGENYEVVVSSFGRVQLNRL